MDDRIVSTAVLTLSRQQEEFLARYRTHEAQQAYFESYGLGVTPFFRGGGGSHGVIPPSPEPELPYDYEVEYLEQNEGTGLLSIDPEISISGSDYELEMIVNITNNSVSSVNPSLYYSIGNDNALYHILRNGGVPLELLLASNSTGNVLSAIKYNTNKFINIKVTGSAAILDGLAYPYNGNATIKLPESKLILLGDFKERGFYFYLQLQRFKLTKGSEVVRDMISVSKNDIGYMYDKVSGKLFGAQGDGLFVVGPRKE